jgi:hypothetical protein
MCAEMPRSIDFHQIKQSLVYVYAIPAFLGMAFSDDRFIFGASNLFGRKKDGDFEEPQLMPALEHNARCETLKFGISGLGVALE